MVQLLGRQINPVARLFRALDCKDEAKLFEVRLTIFHVCSENRLQSYGKIVPDQINPVPCLFRDGTVSTLSNCLGSD
jgi:hypothetical protein